MQSSNANAENVPRQILKKSTQIVVDEEDEENNNNDDSNNDEVVVVDSSNNNNNDEGNNRFNALRGVNGDCNNNNNDKTKKIQKPHPTTTGKAGGGGQNKKNVTAVAEEIPIFTLMNGEAPFLVGVKGRNISLIRKFSGMAIYIRDDQVSMVPQRFNANADLAQRMVLSACYGGILRWFDTPAATKRGYPDDRVPALEELAGSFDMSIDLLRSKRGHMCLMLIPQPTENNYLMDHLEIVKAKISEARVALLEALSPSTPTTIVE